ncbi:MAG: DNA gyrase inhibitor YacG [Proteobacteria bacterium]|nr:DNA gyrase inhibitor YacG [Pseudomonadota bacterium]
MNKPPIVPCPRCGKESPWDTNNLFRPFCSERCKMIDLGKWADEEFRVALPNDEQEFTEPNYQA